MLQKAEQIIKIVNSLPNVKGCTVYGSITNGTYDELSDIDLQVDVSGVDNGQFMLNLVDMLQGKIDIVYSDYAPSLIPDYYIVSVAIDKNNPFLIVDFRCVATPHKTTVQKEFVKKLNDKYSHILKLWTANLKHFARKKDCRDDIVAMAQKIDINVQKQSEKELLYLTLTWLKDNVSDKFAEIIKSCEMYFDKLTQ